MIIAFTLATLLIGMVAAATAEPVLARTPVPRRVAETFPDVFRSGTFPC